MKIEVGQISDRNKIKFRAGVIGTIVCVVAFIISFYMGIISCGPNPIYCHLNNPVGAWAITCCGFSLVCLVTSMLLIDNVKRSSVDH